MSRKTKTEYTRYSSINENPTPEEIKNDDPIVDAGEVTESEEAVVEEEPKAPAPKKKGSKKGEVGNCTMVNVRSDADPNAKIICVIYSGEALNVFEEKNGFYKVTVKDNVEGFINKNYVIVK